ncbi:replicative DNA helicase domain protein (plasmid) [Borreliella bissettiae DN127]|uniref:Replicative DNA helicase domain protein n=1 Tax=Borrelia bissettiae (strain DSM 17990 / CIP 109136 / DN127) TaxID=521010 RepID=G0AP36_BORBD|nr:hypothetical protein [Borreliella bissettiae]AEL19462.1 replicative DNA helicase domain protein [Borreliella bissettiae DN127]
MLFDNVQNKANLIELTYRNKNLAYVDDIAKEVDMIFKMGDFFKNSCIEIGFRGLDGVIQGFGQCRIFIIIGARLSLLLRPT